MAAAERNWYSDDEDDSQEQTAAEDVNTEAQNPPMSTVNHITIMCDLLTEWQYGIVLTHWCRPTKLLYVGSGWCSVGTWLVGTGNAVITIVIRLRYNDTTTHSTMTEVIEITICVRFSCDTTTTKN